MHRDRSFQRLKSRAIGDLSKHVVLVRIRSSYTLSSSVCSRRALFLQPRVRIRQRIVAKYLEELRVRDTLVSAHDIVDEKLRVLVVFQSVF